MPDPKDYRTVGVVKKSPTDVKEKQLSKDMDAYKRLRRQGLQPPQINGCSKLEKEGITKDEIQTGVIPTHLSPSQRRNEARRRREAMDRVHDFD